MEDYSITDSEKPWCTVAVFLMASVGRICDAKRYGMGDVLIPADVQTFLLQYIDSIAQLEALLLLRGTPTCSWNAETLAQRLYITAQEAARVLERLAEESFVTPSPEGLGTYQYHPATDELAHMVDRVAVLYAKYLIPVTNLIHTKPHSRVHEFAEAFKLRKRD